MILAFVVCVYDAVYLSNSCRYFNDPHPEYRVVSEAVSSFKTEIYRSLKSGVNRLCSFNVLFRTDVFQYLFKGKGKDCPHKLDLFYDLEDFNEAFFTSGWHAYYDRLGDGCAIDFPLRMHSKLQWSPIGYDKDPCGGLVSRKRSFKEVCSVSVVKVHS